MTSGRLHQQPPEQMKGYRDMKRWKKSLSCLLLSGILLTAGCGTGKESTEGTDSGTFDPNSPAASQKTQVIQQLIRDKYFGDLDKSEQEEAYYDGLIKGLGDRYATYYTPEEFAQDQEDDSGEYVGIGATVSQDDNGTVYVVEPMEGSPAEEAGLMGDDAFVEIDGVQLTSDMSLEEVVKMIRGSEATSAHLKIYRQGEKDYLEFDIPRRKIVNITAKCEMLENGVGYIKVSSFIANTADQFKECVDSVISQGARAIVFDFRNNLGGLTDIANAMVDYIVPDNTVAEGGDPSKPGLLLEMKDKNGKILYSDYTKDGHEVLLPMAILMNDYSASSSEIFIGALRDYGKAILVGDKTFGKGIVQQTFPLTDGSAVKLTIAKYYLPGGSNIHETGIEPDYAVELPIEKLRILNKLPHNEDPQLAKALEALGMDPLPEPETEAASTESTESVDAGGSTESTEE